MDYPTRLALIELFWSEPEIDEDVRIFRVKENDLTTLLFSYDQQYDWVKTVVIVAGTEMMAVCNEGLTRMWIDDDVLRATCQSAGMETSLRIRLRPIRVEWNGLIQQLDSF